MKRLLLFLLCQGSLDSFSQEKLPNPQPDNYVDWGYFLGKDGRVHSTSELDQKLDTTRASLLITRGHMQGAYNYEGYVVKQGEKIIGYLDDRKKPFKVPVKVWGWMIMEY